MADSITVSRPDNRMMLSCSRCGKATFEGERFCCDWAKDMINLYLLNDGNRHIEAKYLSELS